MRFQALHLLTLLPVLALSVATLGVSQDSDKKPAAKVETSAAIGDAYTLDFCPVTGEPLGSMGDPLALVVEGRAVKVCCKGCIGKLQKDPAKYLAKVDEALIAAQKPYYPLKTCVVTGEPLSKDGADIGVDAVIGNRLFRLCCKDCITKVKEDPAKYFALLDKAVIEAQGPHYPLTTCLVAEKSKLGSMGDPVELVIGNRLVRFCCKSCVAKFEANPAAHLAKLDAAWAKQRAAQDK